MVTKEYFSLSEVADMLSTSKETLRRWDNNGKLVAKRHPLNKYRVYHKEQLKIFEQLSFLFQKHESNFVRPTNEYYSIELFAGAGGLALGLEQAGLKTAMLNEFDKHACQTLRVNRPNWNVVEGDVADLSFDEYADKIDVVVGGFPCQAFSYAGNRLGLDDARGTLFYEFARAVKTIKPLICVGENVRGLLTHENGRTLEGM